MDRTIETIIYLAAQKKIISSFKPPPMDRTVETVADKHTGAVALIFQPTTYG